MERDTIRLSEHGRSSVRCRTWTFWSLLSACTTGDFDVKLMLIAIVIFNIFLFRMSFKTLSFDYFFLSFCISFVHFHLRRGSVYWIVLKKNCRKLLGLKRQKKCDTAIPYNEGININEDNLRSVGHIFDIVFFIRLLLFLMGHWVMLKHSCLGTECIRKSFYGFVYERDERLTTNGKEWFYRLRDSCTYA